MPSLCLLRSLWRRSRFRPGQGPTTTERGIVRASLQARHSCLTLIPPQPAAYEKRSPTATRHAIKNGRQSFSRPIRERQTDLRQCLGGDKDCARIWPCYENGHYTGTAVSSSVAPGAHLQQALPEQWSQCRRSTPGGVGTPDGG